MEFINVEEAVNKISNNTNLLISGFGNYGYPNSLLKALKEKHEKDNNPKNLTIITGISAGNLSYEEEGLNLIANPKLVNKVITTHMGMSKKMAEMLSEIETYTIPLGIYLEILEAITRQKKFVISKIGLNSFCDPRLEGCRVSSKANDNIVNLINIDKEDYLLYKCFDINASFIKTDICDKKGNVAFRKDSIITDALDVAMATKSKLGKIIVEVEEVVDELDYTDVLIPNFLIDFIVIAKKAKPNDLEIEPKQNTKRMLCANRAFQEIKENDIINLGVGMPDTLSKLIEEKSIKTTLTIESGMGGGIPKIGPYFGTTNNPTFRLSLFSMLKLYQSNILDICFLGAAQIDKKGNVNVSKFGKRIIGPGGFIDIVSNAKKIVFMTSLVTKENKPKFKNEIDQITFASINALNNKVEVLYITDICVFKLTNNGLTLIEVNNNINIEDDILSKIEFKPEIEATLLNKRKDEN